MNTGKLVRILAVVLSMCLTVPAFSASKQAAPASAPASQAAITGQSGTLLPDGSWLLIGGQHASGSPSGVLALRDAQGSEKQLPMALRFPRSGHTATVLPDGTVLILGGTGADGRIVKDAEIFDPEAQTIGLLGSSSPTPRTSHSATLLTDGRVLIVGGLGSDGKAMKNAELWDPRQKTLSTTAGAPASARSQHTATLLPDGRVVFNGGKDDNGQAISSAEIFDPQSETFSQVSDVQALQPRLAGIAEITATSPEDGATEVGLNALISMRFSRPLRIESLNSQTVVLSGPQGFIEARVVGAEGGMLAFVTPAKALLPGTSYSVKISGAVDSGNANIAFSQFTFTTVEGDSQDDLFTPTADGMAHNIPTTKWQSMSPLQAAPGITALAGQVLKLDGTPLRNVTLQIGGRRAVSDHTGRFLMTGLAPGHQTMMILGETANTPARKYGIYEVGVDVVAGLTTALNYTIWMTPLDTLHAVRIPSPTTSEIVITTPLLPGLELHLPAQTVITDRNGKTVTELSITAIPINRPPFPLPKVPVPIYFTIQPGSAYIKVATASGAKGARLFYPNSLNYPPGTPYQFWNYDASQKGWFIYGQGKVSADRAHIVPNPGVEIYELTGAMVANPGNAPPNGPQPGGNSKDGEPVDLGTGLFVYEKTDLMLPDVMPLVLTRTYRPNDPVSRAFGVGTSHSYDMFVVGDNNTFPEGYTYQDLILPDGGRIHFQRTSPCTGTNGYCDFNNAVYQHTTTGTDFFGAVLKFQSCSPSGMWTLTKKDGTVYCFPDSDASNNYRKATPTAIRDRYGNTVSFTRDSNANLTQVMSPNGRWIQFTYDASNRVTQAKDNSGRTVSYSYDTGGRLTQVTDANGGIWNYGYDASNEMTTIQDPRGIVYLTNHYDANGRVTQQTQADNTNFFFSYSTDPTTGSITQTDVTDPRGIIKRTAFNANGLKTSEILALGLPEQETISYARDPNTNLITSITDPLSRQTSFTYDSLGNLTSVTRLAGTPNAATTSFTYESNFSQLTSITDPLNHTTTFSYDVAGNMANIADPLGHQITLAYNSHGLPVTITDALGDFSQFAYDGADLVSITDALGNNTSRFVDSIGRLLAVTDATGHITRFTYNSLNQVLQMVDPLQGTTSVTYDLNGNPLTVTNSRGLPTSWTYDGMDRVLTRTDALARQQSYSYDGNGNVATFTDRKGQVTSYKYDGLNRLNFVGFGTQGSGNSATYASSITYQYDGGNRLTQALDSVAGTITQGFDNLDRLTSVATPQGSITYGYDLAGRRTSMTVAGQTAVSYAYDNADRLTQVSQGSSAVNFSYDNANRRASMTLPNGINITYAYDNDSRVTGMTYSFGSSTLGTLAYAYDSLGRRTQMGGTFARTGLPQPVASATYDSDNELTNWNSLALSYDANGNMLSDGTNSFAWDSRNHLSAINGAPIQYDAFGRRTQNPAARSLLYDGFNPIQELTGSTVGSNMLAGNVDETFTRTDSFGAFSLLTDVLGSTIALADANGNIQTSYTYDPFGGTGITGASSTNEFQFTGRENDGNGLYYYRARYYNPMFGRFISQDPLGFGGGDVNLYAYVRNSPTNLVDPSGKNPAIIAIVAGIGAVGGGVVEGMKGYACGDRGWDLASDIGRGITAGAVSSVVGLAVGFFSENPALGGAAGSETYNLINSIGGPPIDPVEFAVDAAMGAGMGMAGEFLTPAVRGGWNFNPFKSPRTYGPKAMQQYTDSGIENSLNLGYEAGKLAGKGCNRCH